MNSVSLEIFVVAYNYSAGNLEKLRKEYPAVTVIVSDGGCVRGFSENNNLALREASGKYCFIVNDDTLMDEPVVDRLVNDLEALGEKAAAVSPCIRFPGGRIQTLGRAPWSRWRYFLHYMHLVDETRPSRWSMKEGLFQTYTLNGACFLIRTAVFREAGWFDERYFFTPEDIALGHRLNEMGYSVWARSDVSITHFAGGSVSSMEAAIKPARVRGSMVFYGEPFLLKCFIWAFEGLRVLKYSFLPSSPHNRIMKASAKNVMASVWSRLSPKEIFKRFM